MKKMKVENVLTKGDRGEVLSVKYDEEDAVFKSYQGSFAEDRYRVEKNALIELEDQKMPAPKLIDYDDADMFLIEEKIEGKSLKHIAQDPDKVMKYIEGVKELENTHTEKESRWKRDKDFYDFLKEVYSTDVLSKAEKKLDKNYLKKLEKNLENLIPDNQEEFPNEYTLLNGDLKAEEIIIDEKGKIGGILDWENRMFGEQAFDTASIINSLGQRQGFEYESLLEKASENKEEKKRMSQFLGWYFGTWGSYFSEDSNEFKEMLEISKELMGGKPLKKQEIKKLSNPL